MQLILSLLRYFLGVASGVPIFCFRKVYIEVTNPHSKVVFFAAEKKSDFSRSMQNLALPEKNTITLHER